MKNKYRLIIPLALLLFIISCGKSFLETTPQAQIIDEQLSTTKAVNQALIGAYGLLNGNVNGTWGNYSAAPSQWLFGEVAADNAHKGSSNQDQSPMNDIELHKVISSNDNLPSFWRSYYEGIIRCNLTLTLLKNVQNAGQNDQFSDEDATLIEAQARFLRAHYYFFLRRVFAKIPYLSDSITNTVEATQIPNDKEVYPMIEADLKMAVANLPYDKIGGEVGRVDKYAAQSLLGKVYLYERKYAEALTEFKAVINKKPDLVGMPFENNFDINTENGPESIFTAQHIINPDGTGDNGNVGDMLSGLYGTAPVSCCGFFQPSIDLVNAYKVDSKGLPLLDDGYRDGDVYVSDLGLAGTAKKNYKVDKTIAFDPRLDYTVGRRGVPFKDWGVFPGDDWMRDPSFAGPFVSKKQMIDIADFAGNTVPGTEQITGLNVNIIRLADVYLMAAECAVKTGDLPYALKMVNDVRNRAAKIPPIELDGTPMAKYNVKPYPSFPNADYAMKAVHFERRLELALEGQRFYDLVRWGIAKTTIESYQKFENGYVSASQPITFQPKDTIFPIPQEELDRAPGVLEQNAAGK